jgi:hypothetical protein
MPPFHVWLTTFGLFLIRVAKMNQKNLKKLQPSKIGAAIMIQAKEGKNGQGNQKLLPNATTSHIKGGDLSR